MVQNTLRKEFLQTGSVRCKYLRLNFASDLSQLGVQAAIPLDSRARMIALNAALQFVWAKFCKFSVVAVQSIIYETEFWFL